MDSQTQPEVPKIDYKKLCDILIEGYCDAYGANDAIQFLLRANYSVYNLVELRFDLDDVNKVKKEMEEEEEEEEEED
jgi:lipoprotein NlpI